MPWSNQTGSGGGGGWKSGGGNTGGPWGQGPKAPRPGGNPSSPDLEDILRRGQDRLRRAMPGGGGAGGGRGAGGGIAIGGLALAGLAVIWLLNAVYVIEPDEIGVELLFGEPREDIVEPGLHFILWPFETVETVPSVENQMPIGRNTNNDTTGLMLSGDQNLVDVEFSVLYQVADPQAFLFNVNDPQAMLRQVSESAMREVVGRSAVDDLFRDDRIGIAEQVRAITQATLESYGAGLRVNAIAIEDTAPPAEVASAFDEVQRARQDQTRFVNEAEQYRNQRLGQARSEAVQIREDAAAYKDRVVQEAEGESQRFSSILTEYEKAPDITRQRLYLETMESVLRDSNMVIVDEETGGQGVVPYLPLTEVQRQSAEARAANAAAAAAANDPAAGTPAAPGTQIPGAGATIVQGSN